MKGKIIVARAPGHGDRRCGKWCEMNGERIFLCDVDDRWMHQNSDSWPINAAVLDHLERLGVRHLYLRPKKLLRTYRTDIDTIRRYGFTTQAKAADWRAWGPNINLDKSHWERLPFRLSGDPWIADDALDVVVIEEQAKQPALFGGDVA